MILKHRLLIDIFLLFLAINGHVFGQGVFDFKARVYSTKDNQPVMFGHVFNESRNISALTDTTGTFSIPSEKGDTLVVNAMGYYPFVIFVEENTDSISVFYQRDKYYEIAEVQVTALGTYEHFKQKILHLDIPETQNEILRNNLQNASFSAAKDIKRRPSVAEQHNPIPSGIKVASILTPYEKQLQSYRSYMKKEARRKVIYKKYNKDLIHQITHLNEPLLTDFYAWLDFKEEWLFMVTQYEIGKAIKDNFPVYLAEKGYEGG